MLLSVEEEVLGEGRRIDIVEEAAAISVGKCIVVGVLVVLAVVVIAADGHAQVGCAVAVRGGIADFVTLSGGGGSGGGEGLHLPHLLLADVVVVVLERKRRITGSGRLIIWFWGSSIEGAGGVFNGVGVSGVIGDGRII